MEMVLKNFMKCKQNLILGQSMIHLLKLGYLMRWESKKRETLDTKASENFEGRWMSCSNLIHFEKLEEAKDFSTKTEESSRLVR